MNESMYTIGLLARIGCCNWDGSFKVGGAINIAMDQLREDRIMDGFVFR